MVELQARLPLSVRDKRLPFFNRKELDCNEHHHTAKHTVTELAEAVKPYLALPR
jgi:hypothetical protein